MLPVSAIKLIRTDTTLDLSQKAEKGMFRRQCPRYQKHNHADIALHQWQARTLLFPSLSCFLPLFLATRVSLQCIHASQLNTALKCLEMTGIKPSNKPGQGARVHTCSLYFTFVILQLIISNGRDGISMRKCLVRQDPFAASAAILTIPSLQSLLPRQYTGIVM